MTPSAPTAPTKRPRPTLGRNYWRLWWANAVSSTGDGAFAAALPLLAVTITRDPRLVSVVTAATYLPWMVLSLPAGALVNRYDRVTLMWRAQAVQAAVVAVLLGVSNFAGQMGQATLVLLATQTLHISTRGYGLVLAATAVGSVLGGLMNPLLTRRLGLLPSLIISMGAVSAVFVGIGLAPDPVVLGVLMAADGFFVTMWNVVTVSLRQQLVPSALLGRVNSAYRMVGWGLIPVGALAGGFVAYKIGLRASYTVGGIVCGVVLLAALPFLLSAARPRD